MQRQAIFMLTKASNTLLTYNPNHKILTVYVDDESNIGSMALDSLSRHQGEGFISLGKKVPGAGWYNTLPTIPTIPHYLQYHTTHNTTLPILGLQT